MPLRSLCSAALDPKQTAKLLTPELSRTAKWIGLNELLSLMLIAFSLEPVKVFPVAWISS